MTAEHLMRTYLTAVLAILTIAGSLQAQDTLRYRQGGNWTEISDGTVPGWGFNPADPGSRVPTGTDLARINWGGSTVTVDSEVPEFNRLEIGVDEGGTVEVNDGGVLTTTQDIVVGNNGFIDAFMDVNDGAVVDVGRILWVARGPNAGDVLGFLNINAGGTVNVASHLWWGTTGIAEINIAGTLNQTSGILGLGTQNASTPLGGRATVNILSGGEMNLNNISANEGLPSIQPNSKIDIQGTGRLTLPGDFVTTLEAYRDANLIEGDGVPGAVTIQTEPGGLPAGDFNSDGVVDAADYTVYRDNVGAASLPNSGGLGTVGEQHYDLWSTNLGATGSGSLITVVTAGLPPASTAIPEPGAVSLLVLVGGCLVGRSRRRSA